MRKEQYVYRLGDTCLEALLVNGISCGGYNEDYFKLQGFEIYDDWKQVSNMLDEAQEKRYIKPWQEIAEDQWEQALEVLPPNRWEFCHGWSFFQSSELTIGNITATYAKIGNSYYTANRKTSAKYEDLIKEIVFQFRRQISNAELADLSNNWHNATVDTSKYYQTVLTAYEINQDIYNWLKGIGTICQEYNGKFYTA